MRTPGQVAYDAYRREAGDLAMVCGEYLPDFEDLPAPSRKAWEVAAEAVMLEYGAIYG